MKKYVLSILSLIILLPCVVLAKPVENPDYKVVASYISADIDIVGSMHVREAYVVKGALNGYERVIHFRNSSYEPWEAGKVNFEESSFYNARNLSLSKLSAKKITKDEIGWDLVNSNYDKFIEDENPNNGDEKVFYKVKEEDGYRVRVYNPNEDDYMVYYFDYYVDQAVVLHNDVAEIYYTFFELDKDDVDNVCIKVTTPTSGTNEKFRFWAHAVKSLNGTISGIVDKKNDKGEELYKGVLLEMKDYQKGEIIDVRMTFDKSIYSSLETVLNNSKMDGLPNIINVEEKRAEDANKRRLVSKVLFFGTLIIGCSYLIGLIIIWIYIYKKYDREYKVSFNLKYYREFIDEYDVEIVDYLINKNITTNALNASIMNLIYKKNIEIEEIVDEKNSKKKDIILKLKNRDKISASEGKLLDLLFSTIGHDNKVSLKEIEDYSSNYSTASSFMKAYENWRMIVTTEGINQNFYENHGTVKAIASLYFVLGLIIIGIVLITHVELYILVGAILLSSLAFLIYVLTFKKWTLRGREHYLKWMAFKNFLKDFGLLSEKDIPDIVLWDKYLVYATVLGIAKEVQKTMKVKLTEMGVDEVNTGLFYYNNYYMFDRISTCMSDAQTKSISTINAHDAMSSASSGSGFGGGFSGGGGHAGGGGGGGGF